MFLHKIGVFVSITDTLMVQTGAHTVDMEPVEEPCVVHFQPHVEGNGSHAFAKHVVEPREVVGVGCVVEYERVDVGEHRSGGDEFIVVGGSKGRDIFREEILKFVEEEVQREK